MTGTHTQRRRAGTGPDRSEGSATRPDVVLVTIDAWRADAVERMPTLRRLASENGYDSSRAVSGSAATHGAFPPILASDHIVRTYDTEGGLRPGASPLPEALADHGYRTGAVVGSNPFLARWSRCFDYFWNDGMREDVEFGGPNYSTVDRVQRFLRLQKRVTATAVAERASEWYRGQDPPRFLWMHLMDAHGPYFPGLRGARRTGVYRTYRTLFDYHVRDRESPETLAHLRELYHRCLKRLDDRLAAVLDFVDSDAVVVLTGDHGEEFDHGFHGHAQLYDECVTTPLLTANLPHPMAECDVRHLDIGPTILDAVGLPSPTTWAGTPVDGTTRHALLFNHSPDHERTYVGVRTGRHKFIKSFDHERWTVEERALYDLAADPGERTPVKNPDVARELEHAVDSFLAQEDVELETIRQTTTGIDADVERRLEELGYV